MHILYEADMTVNVHLLWKQAYWVGQIISGKAPYFSRQTVMMWWSLCFIVLSLADAYAPTCSSQGYSAVLLHFFQFRGKFFNASDLSETNSLTLTNTVLDISTFSGRYMIAASTSIQLIDRESPERRRTIADDVAEDENLEDPPLHLVRFGPKGQVATASVESNILKLWPSVAQTSSPNMQPENRIQVQENKDTTGYIYSLTVSPHSNSPWIAVGFQPGEMLKPEGYKKVNCYDWNTRQLHHIFDAGAGGLDTGVSAEFSLDGKQLAIGCAEHLCIWETKTGDLLQKHTIANQAAINCLRFSPNGMHIAVGLDSGQIQVFHIVCGLFMFCLPATLCHSPVSAISYSSCGKKFASGYKNGILRLWEAYVGETETTAS